MSDNEARAREWRDLCEKGDRTSLPEYPDMALITQDEFFAALDAAEDRGRAAGLRDAARWQALVTTFGPEADVSTPHRPHTMLIAIDTYGCEIREDGRLNFKETLERALDDEIRLQSETRIAEYEQAFLSIQKVLTGLAVADYDRRSKNETDRAEGDKH